MSLLAACGLKQHIQGPTQKDGGTLDLVVTCEPDSPFCGLPCVDYRISDHDTILMKIKSDKLQHVIKEVIYWKFDSINMDSFRRNLASLELCTDPSDTLDLLVEQYNEHALYVVIQREIDLKYFAAFSSKTSESILKITVCFEKDIYNT